MNILVTGCNGQLGNEIQLLEKDHSQHVFFNTDIDELDITNQSAIEAFVEDNKIDGIINCAAYTAVDKAESNKELATSLNTIAPAYLAAAVNKRDGWFIQVSTDYVFDGTKHTPYVEDDTPCPNSVYGSTKFAGELGAVKFCAKTMIIRTAWLYSTFGNNFVKTMMRLGKEKEQLGVIFDQIGTPTYAHDLAVVIMTAIEKGIVSGTYHFSNEGVISWYDFTLAIFETAGITHVTVNPVTSVEYGAAAKRPYNSRLDRSKIREMGFEPLPDWRDALSRYVRILKEME